MRDEEGGGGIVLVVSALLVVGLLAGLLLPVFFATRVRPHSHSRCASNIKQIGYACHLYSGDHNEEFPPGLGRLFPEYIPDGNIFQCPTARCAVVIREANLPPGATDASAVFGPEHTDYDYVSGLDATDPPDLVLAFDRRGNHGAGRNVLFIGANVDWMKEKEFQAALAKTREYMQTRHDARKMGGPKRSP